MDINDLTNLTWEALASPVPLSIFLVVFMSIIGKPLIDAVHDFLISLASRGNVVPEGYKWRFYDGEEVPPDWGYRSLIVNLVTLLVASIMAAFHVGPSLSSGDAAVLALVATAIAIGEYEVVKNTVKFIRTA